MNIETCRHEFITLLQLQTVLQGNDVDVWQRVHVTVSVQGSTSCEGITTRISLTPVNNDGVEMTLSDNRLTELGCEEDSELSDAVRCCCLALRVTRRGDLTRRKTKLDIHGVLRLCP